MNKVLNLRETKIPLKFSGNIDTNNISISGKFLENPKFKISIAKISKDLYQCNGEINCNLLDKCQSCLDTIKFNHTFIISTLIKDIQDLEEDKQDVGVSHFQDLKFFYIDLLVEEEICLNYPVYLFCENENCLPKLDDENKSSNLPFKKIRDLID
tara:strand:- start:12609 stop:13073 length:465 start_codon:yes stop_codon:yes gene_type:complete